MNQITIDKEIKDITPDFHIGVLELTVSVYDSPEMDQLIQQYETNLSASYDITDVVTLPIIKDGRDAYKAYGKDPSRYRLAVESLYRRIVKGNQLYRVNNVVDAGNILSLETRKSVAVLDKDNIVGPIVVRLGHKQDEYHGIGRGKLNIDRIPLYQDSLGPFGSTTSDTERTKITYNTTSILLFIISFSGVENMTEDIRFAEELYARYCNGITIEKFII